MTHPWRTVSDEKQLEVVRAALEAEKGNVTRAAEKLDLARSHLRKIVKKLGLEDFAAERRLAAGGRRGLDGRVTGRPRK